MSSQKPSVWATANTPSHSRPAASPVGASLIDRAEEGRAGHVDDRRAHVVAHRVHAHVVGGPQGLVVAVGAGGLGQMEGQAGLLQGRRVQAGIVAPALHVDLVTERRVQRA